MNLKLVEDLLKLGIAGICAWVGNYIRKNAVPFYKQVIILAKLAARVEIMERRIYIAESKQMVILYTSTDPSFITNTKGEVVFVNPAWLDMTGISTANDAYGFGYMQAIPIEDREALREQSEILVDHPGPFSGAVRFKNVRSGDIIDTLCRSEIVRFEGIPVETVGRLYVIKK